MAERVAFFAGKEEVENYYNIKTKKESLFDEHYNLSPGHQLPVIAIIENDVDIKRVRWGKRESDKTTGITTEKEELTQKLGEDDVERCILPLSGFYIWKDDKETNEPFFVRLLNDSIMSVAGIYNTGNHEFVSIVTTESNALIQPMADRMPLFIDRPTALQWLDPGIKTENLLEQAKNQFLLTDLSVLRVSKDVNDPSNNSPELIQPIPK